MKPYGMTQSTGLNGPVRIETKTATVAVLPRKKAPATTTTDD